MTILKFVDITLSIETLLSSAIMDRILYLCFHSWFFIVTVFISSPVQGMLDVIL